ncbi:hypothetical protein BDZ97DRAFT_1766105 [Flammula alnicola]|nr:hypothetical protein BDZ97DRAFT_1766105 [Flammula alnicola]
MTGGRTEPKLVSKSTYHAHEPFRVPSQPAITPMAEFLAQQPWHPAALPQPRNSTPGPSIPRRRSRSPSANPTNHGHSRSPSSEPPRQRQRRDLDPNPDEGIDADRHGHGEPDIGTSGGGEMGSPRREDDHYSDDSDIYVRVRTSFILVPVLRPQYPQIKIIKEFLHLLHEK